MQLLNKHSSLIKGLEPLAGICKIIDKIAEALLFTVNLRAGNDGHHGVRTRRQVVRHR